MQAVYRAVNEPRLNRLTPQISLNIILTAAKVTNGLNPYYPTLYPNKLNTRLSRQSWNT